MCKENASFRDETVAVRGKRRAKQKEPSKTIVLLLGILMATNVVHQPQNGGGVALIGDRRWCIQNLEATTVRSFSVESSANQHHPRATIILHRQQSTSRINKCVFNTWNGLKIELVGIESANA